MIVVNIENDIVYLLNQKKIKNILNKYLLIKDDVALNGELLIENRYSNINIIDPRFIGNGVKKNEPYNKVTIIGLGLNFISSLNYKELTLYAVP